jgi:hypothetical protein
MSTINEELHFFVDRSLGGLHVPAGPRLDGWLLTTMDERYGVDRSQSVADVDWIRDASAQGECMLTNDTAIARRPAEATVVRMCGARVFALARADLTGPQMLEVFLAHKADIMRWAARVSGPFVSAVSQSGLRRLRLND